jgi:MoaA/NifB/PqqE/SkfB family radical SAM enzyme
VERELSTEEWKTILQKAWDAGIPHITFTGGEPTLRDDLVELIEYAEELGQVTGLLTDGVRLADKDYLDQILQSGLDHLMLTLDPENETAWSALEIAMPEDIHVTVHLTITEDNRDNYTKLFDRLVALEVTSLSLSASRLELEETLKVLGEAALARGDLSLVWDIPVPYSASNPVLLELQEREEPVIRGDGKAWLYVEPDGDVLEAQGKPDVLGNFLKQPWSDIWQ